MYIRVIPRDLFNEADLLKWLGRLYLASEHLSEGALRIEKRHDDSRDGWLILQDPMDGSIHCDNVLVYLHGRELRIFRPLNARRASYEAPAIYASVHDQEGDPVEVFDCLGELTEHFLELVPAVAGKRGAG